jgi:hypothetical protein
MQTAQRIAPLHIESLNRIFNLQLGVAKSSNLHTLNIEPETLKRRRHSNHLVQSCHGAILYVQTQNFASQQKQRSH